METKTKQEYTNLIKRFIKYFPIIKLKQLIYALSKFDDKLEMSEIQDILWDIEDEGHILISQDGWCLSKSSYLDLTGDTFFEHVDITVNTRLDKVEPYCKKRFNDSGDNDFIWLIATLLPESKNFIYERDSLFKVIFEAENEVDCSLVEICKIRKNKEQIDFEILRSLPKPDPEIKDCLHRIALMEDWYEAKNVPYVGFASVVMIKEDEKEKLEILAQRGEDKWRECFAS